MYSMTVCSVQGHDNKYSGAFIAVSCFFVFYFIFDSDVQIQNLF